MGKKEKDNYRRKVGKRKERKGDEEYEGKVKEKDGREKGMDI